MADGKVASLYAGDLAALKPKCKTPIASRKEKARAKVETRPPSSSREASDRSDTHGMSPQDVAPEKQVVTARTPAQYTESDVEKEISGIDQPAPNVTIRPVSPQNTQIGSVTIVTEQNVTVTSAPEKSMEIENIIPTDEPEASDPLVTCIQAGSIETTFTEGPSEMNDTIFTDELETGGPMVANIQTDECSLQAHQGTINTPLVHSEGFEGQNEPESDANSVEPSATKPTAGTLELPKFVISDVETPLSSTQMVATQFNSPGSYLGSPLIPEGTPPSEITVDQEESGGEADTVSEGVNASTGSQSSQPDLKISHQLQGTEKGKITKAKPSPARVTQRRKSIFLREEVDSYEQNPASPLAHRTRSRSHIKSKISESQKGDSSDNGKGASGYLNIVKNSDTHSPLSDVPPKKRHKRSEDEPKHVEEETEQNPIQKGDPVSIG